MCLQVVTPSQQIKYTFHLVLDFWIYFSYQSGSHLFPYISVELEVGQPTPHSVIILLLLTIFIFIFFKQYPQCLIT